MVYGEPNVFPFIPGHAKSKLVQNKSATNVRKWKCTKIRTENIYLRYRSYLDELYLRVLTVLSNIVVDYVSSSFTVVKFCDKYLTAMPVHRDLINRTYNAYQHSTIFQTNYFRKIKIQLKLYGYYKKKLCPRFLQ